MAEELSQQGPFENEELKDIYSSAKKMALAHFNKTAVGDVKEDYLDGLRDKMKAKYNQIKTDNEHLCEQSCLNFLRT